MTILLILIIHIPLASLSVSRIVVLEPSIWHFLFWIGINFEAKLSFCVFFPLTSSQWSAHQRGSCFRFQFHHPDNVGPTLASRPEWNYYQLQYQCCWSGRWSKEAISGHWIV